MALQISAEFPGLMSLTVPIALLDRFSSDYSSLNDLLSIRHSDSSLRLFLYPYIVLHGTACPSVLAHGALE